MPAAGAGRCWVAAEGLAVGVAGLSVRGDQPWRPGAGEEGSQPYLGARGAGCCPGDKMFDWVSPPAGMRPLSLIRPSAWVCAARSRRRLTGGLQELAAVVPHRVSVAAGVPARGPACPRRGLHETLGLSGGGERVVAELGQDVAGLPDDLAGLGQGGALAVLAVLDGGVIAVVGSRSAAVGLAGLIHRPAQHRRALPGQPARRALPVRGPYGDVQPGEPDRLAGRGEPARPAQPAGQRQRGHWPGPIQPRRQHPGAG